MSDLLSIILILLVFFALIGCVWLFVKKVELENKVKAAATKAGAPAAAADADDADGAAGGEGGGGPEVPYVVREEVLTKGERAFFPVLREAVRLLAEKRKLPEPIVFASVRFAEILSVGIEQKQNRSLWQIGQNRINRKQADFVICDQKTTRPLVVVELDDSSHDKPRRKDRDAFIDRACGSAGLPVLHVPAASRYDPMRLAEMIAEKLSSRLS